MSLSVGVDSERATTDNSGRLTTDYGRLQMQTADIVVIGGGVMGTSIAFHLARRGAGRVLVLEKSFLGAGSSGKSGAIIRQHYSHPLTASMAQHGLRFFERFTDIVGGPPVFTHTGLVAIVAAHDRPLLEANVAMQQGLGIKVSMVSRDELRAIDPHAVLADDEAAALESEAGYCEALQVVASFAQAARRLGTEIRESTPVTGIQIERGRVAAVTTPAGAIATRTVVLAAGPWAGRLAETVGVELPVQPCRAQVALVRRPCEFGPPRPAYGDFRHQIYFKPTHGEMLHVGNIDPREQRAVVDPDDYNDVADCDFVREMRGKLNRRYPALERGVGRGGFGALYEVTPDWHPVIDRLPGLDGAFVAAGFSGHGFKMSPAVGQLIAELVVDGTARTFDIHPLRLTRFAERDLFGGKKAYTVMG
jgi:sarcosine oxidase subunit beta